MKRLCFVITIRNGNVHGHQHFNILTFQYYAIDNDVVIDIDIDMEIEIKVEIIIKEDFNI